MRLFLRSCLKILLRNWQELLLTPWRKRKNVCFIGLNGFRVTLGFTRSKSNICRKVAVQGFAYTANNLHLFTNNNLHGSVCCGELEAVPNPHPSWNLVVL